MRVIRTGWQGQERPVSRWRDNYRPLCQAEDGGLSPDLEVPRQELCSAPKTSQAKEELEDPEGQAERGTAEVQREGGVSGQTLWALEPAKRPRPLTVNEYFPCLCSVSSPVPRESIATTKGRPDTGPGTQHLIYFMESPPRHSQVAGTALRRFHLCAKDS